MRRREPAEAAKQLRKERPDASPPLGSPDATRVDRRRVLRGAVLGAAGALVAPAFLRSDEPSTPATTANPPSDTGSPAPPPDVPVPPLANAPSTSPAPVAAEDAPSGLPPLVIDALSSLGRQGDPPGPLSAGAIDDAAASGVTAIDWTVAAGTDFEETVAAIGDALAEIDRHRERLLLVRRVADIDAARRTNHLGVMLGFQNGAMLADKLDRLELFWSLGVRVIQPTYNPRNQLGDGCTEPENHGLTPLGRQAVARMNDLGILVDLSHCGQATTAEAIRVSRLPVAITHAGCAAVEDHPRNKRDEELRALAERGGVLGVYWMPYLRHGGQPVADDLLRHVEHALAVCGEDHVGIGSDLPVSPLVLTDAARAAHRRGVLERKRLGIGAPGEDPDVFLYLPDLNGPRRHLDFGALLAQRGHSTSRIEKILGGNFLRLFKDVWKV
jgi:membrane dipeptidase